jgi:hypothetical protein
LVLKADGSYTYTPKIDFTGEDSVSYTLNDGELTSTATLTITVSNVNVAPVAINDAVSTPENTTFTSTVSLIANDSDADGDDLTVTAGTFTTNQGGNLVLKADGSYTYTPKTDFTGEDSYDYTLSDGSLTSTATLTITVSNVNVAPVAVNDAISTPENTTFTSTVSLIANDSDADGDDLTVTAGTFTTNQGGSLVLKADGSYTYTPKTDFTGEDSVSYTLSDGELTSTATLTINVSNVNVAPVAVNDNASTDENTIYFSTISLIANDSDADGDDLTVTAGTFTTNQGGSLVLKADGSYTYTPKTDFTGQDSYDYTLSDGSLTSTATLTITVSNVNVAPVAVNDNASTDENTIYFSTISLIANDSDADGDVLTVTAGTFTTNQGGSLVLKADGSYIYTPKIDFTGQDVVNYTLSDGELTSTATLTIIVNKVNNAPKAVNDVISITENTTFYSTQSLIANDTDVDGDAINIVDGTFTTNEGGSFLLNSDGSYTYTPKTDFTGEDAISYVINDGSLTDVGILTIYVNPSNTNNPNNGGNFEGSVGTGPAFADTSLELYPSHVVDEFNIEINSTLYTYGNIYNTNGQFFQKIELNEGINTFNISHYAAGVYLIQIPYSQGVIVKRLIKL